MENIIVSWAGGKDSALALYEILKNENPLEAPSRSSHPISSFASLA